jgi:hypothetical protein
LKKEAKTFTLALSQLGVNLLGLARNPTDKSFLVLFSKKNILPSFAFLVLWASCKRPRERRQFRIAGIRFV